jgi:hypothetical protein
VRIVGVVVAIEDITVKYTTLTIDDGSGENIEVKIVRLTPDIYNPVESPSNTTIPNVDVVSTFGVFEVTVDHQPLDIGSVIKAKGTISEWRGKKQLELKRAWVLSTTNEEARAWAEMATFKENVLSKPWRLTSAEHKKIVQDIESERRKVKRYETELAAYEAKKKEHRRAREEYVAKRDARLEAKRRKDEVMMNAGALI